VDFVIQNIDRVLPIEVKAEENLKAKSREGGSEDCLYNLPFALIEF